MKTEQELREQLVRTVGSFIVSGDSLSDEYEVIHDVFPGDYDQRTARVYALADEILALPALLSRTEQAEAERDALKAENADLTKALTGLTCGGSEFFIRKSERFVADIPACVDYVNRRHSMVHGQVIDAVTRAQAAEASLNERDALLREAARRLCDTEWGSDEEFAGQILAVLSHQGGKA